MVPNKTHPLFSLPNHQPSIKSKEKNVTSQDLFMIQPIVQTSDPESEVLDPAEAPFKLVA